MIGTPGARPRIGHQRGDPPSALDRSIRPLAPHAPVRTMGEEAMVARDDEVEVDIPVDAGGGPPETGTDRRRITGSLALPHATPALVVFAHGSGSSRLSPRNAYVAERLQDA